MSDKYLSNKISKALSDQDILRLINGKAKIVLYPDIKNYKSIDQLLYPYGAVIILYLTRKNYGHWTTLFKLNDNTLEMFNSYGTYIDDDLDYIPENFRISSGQSYPLLGWLMYYSPYKLTYNEHKFQKRGRNINTCGRWVALRLLYRHLSLKEFHNLFKGKDSDKIVTLLTEN